MYFISTKPLNILGPQTYIGQIALWLMLAHAIWATYVIKKGSEDIHKHFHRYSLIVWIIWLIPYFGGMWLAMGR
jgi:uncharacterized repeat protein (TIGR03987 family)